MTNARTLAEFWRETREMNAMMQPSEKEIAEAEIERPAMEAQVELTNHFFVCPNPAPGPSRVVVTTLAQRAGKTLSQDIIAEAMRRIGGLERVLADSVTDLQLTNKDLAASLDAAIRASVQTRAALHNLQAEKDALGGRVEKLEQLVRDMFAASGNTIGKLVARIEKLEPKPVAPPVDPLVRAVGKMR